MDIAIVLSLLLIAVVVFATEWMSMEVFSLLLMVTLAVTGVLTPQQSFMGLSNPAVIMIAGIMLITGGFIHNGAADLLARRIQRFAGRSERLMSVLLLTTVNGLSAIINNVAATAMFIPVAEGTARHFRVSRSRYLMPIAFASMTGGMCTLIGTSTNVAVAGALEQYRLAPLGLFELTPVGLAMVAVGVPYLVLVTPRLLGPARQEEDPAIAYGLRPYLFEIWVREGAAMAGKPISMLPSRLGLTVLAIVRGEDRIVPPQAEEVLQPGDLLLVEGAAGTIPAVQRTAGMEIKSLPNLKVAGLLAAPFRLMEATVSYNSPFIGRTLQELNFRKLYDLSVLALHRRGEVVVEKVGKIPLRAGDVLLIHGHQQRFAGLPHEPTRLLMEDLSLPASDPGRAALATVILLGAIAAGASGWVDTATAFLAGGALTLALGVLPTDLAASYVNIRFLIMVAAMASLGMAMEQSGAARLLADGLVGTLGAAEPLVLLAAFFLLTVVLTQPLSNAAAALLVLPIGSHAAAAAGVDPRSFAVAITIGASCSFITPFEPACLLVYSTGRYKFLDFVKLGTPLTLMALVLSLVLIPWLWPLRG